MSRDDPSDDPYAWYHDDEDPNYPEQSKPEMTKREKIVNYFVTLFLLTVLSGIFSYITWLIFTSVSPLLLAISVCLVPGCFTLFFGIPAIGIAGYGIVCAFQFFFNKD